MSTRAQGSVPGPARACRTHGGGLLADAGPQVRHQIAVKRQTKTEQVKTNDNKRDTHDTHSKTTTTTTTTTTQAANTHDKLTHSPATTRTVSRAVRIPNTRKYCRPPEDNNSAWQTAQSVVPCPGDPYSPQSRRYQGRSQRGTGVSTLWGNRGDRTSAAQAVKWARRLGAARTTAASCGLLESSTRSGDPRCSRSALSGDNAAACACRYSDNTFEYATRLSGVRHIVNVDGWKGRQGRTEAGRRQQRVQQRRASVCGGVGPRAARHDARNRTSSCLKQHPSHSTAAHLSLSPSVLISNTTSPGRASCRSELNAPSIISTSFMTWSIPMHSMPNCSN